MGHRDKASLIETSIVMTAYRRPLQLERTLNSIFCQPNQQSFEVIVVEDGFDGGQTMDVCAGFFGKGYPLFYVRRNSRPKLEYSNQAVPLNIGIKQARGKVLIIQNAECLHVSDRVIEKLTRPHLERSSLAVFAACIRLGEEIAPSNLTSPYFFCGSIAREDVFKLGGFDEEFVGWGAEDCDFANRMKLLGIRFEFRADVMVHHQFHSLANRDKCGYAENKQRMEKKLALMYAGKIPVEANVGKEWGKLA